MSDHSDFKIPDYFKIARPAHFKTRPDLIEELCVAEEMMRILPKNEKERQRWLSRSGQPAGKFSLSTLLACHGHPYVPTERYILSCVVLAGYNFPVHVLRDGRGWAICCEHGGLFAFVVHRAIECAVQLGLDSKTARASFIPTCDKSPAAVRRPALWSIGYDRGVCTILASSVSETDELYLARKNGYHVPFLEDPIF